MWWAAARSFFWEERGKKRPFHFLSLAFSSFPLFFLSFGIKRICYNVSLPLSLPFSRAYRENFCIFLSFLGGEWRIFFFSSLSFFFPGSDYNLSVPYSFFHFPSPSSFSPFSFRGLLECMEPLWSLSPLLSFPPPKFRYEGATSPPRFSVPPFFFFFFSSQIYNVLVFFSFPLPPPLSEGWENWNLFPHQRMSLPFFQ